MLVSVISIGNSKGIRLPKSVLQQLNIDEKLDMEIESGKIILKPLTSAPREGWYAAYEKMHSHGDDNLLVADSGTTEGFEWEW